MRDLKTEKEIMKNWKVGTSAPIVSICCTTYNHENFIEDALKGFLIQETDFPFEILVYDDASTDNTPVILKKYQKLYPSIIKPNFQQINQYSQGIKPNIDFNFSRASGAYIAICEGDDYWTDPKKLSIQVSYLESHPDVVIVYHDCQPFNSSALIDKDFGGARTDLERLDLQKATPIFTLTTCFRNVIKSFPPERYATRYGDKFIWSILGEYGKGKYQPEIRPAMYRIHDKGLHSCVNRKSRIYFSLATYGSLFAYHSRVGNQNLAEYFAGKMFISSLRYLGIRSLFKFIFELFLKALSKPKIIA